MQRFFDDAQAHAAPLGAEYVALWTAMRSASDGGRRLRPALAVEAYRAHGGSDAHAAQRLGDGIELLHTAFVMHDDVIDHDLRRRGRPNVSGEFGSRARAEGADRTAAAGYGQAAGILAGDLALVGALVEIASVAVDTTTRDRLLALVHAAVRVSAAGELDDVYLGLGTRVASVDETLAVAEHKTAAYSFALPLQAGALLAGASPDQLDRLGELGRLLGIAFQLCDDLLGVFGDEAETGKSTLSDLREGKMTALVAYAARTPAWDSIRAQLGDPKLTAADAGTLRARLEACGARSFVESLVESHLQSARALAAAAGLDSVIERVSALAARDTGRAA
ncbi:polyprenyl synthetase family protein [Cellulomonas edaphi]|uniref:Polyprenyl synthetase family protein n=1 Tax=Cellulomonas edaphi TaxID=3053468 RepID=A0ABT7S6R7_9CELL|nr:polyprenyl synthetase family protein [Cellulomons edaphi]MDM7831316.1 polyprenyl synthetase family protein [Cellulomons edaphi]